MKMKFVEKVGRSCVILSPGAGLIEAYCCGNKDGDWAPFEICEVLYRITRQIGEDRIELVRGICEGYLLGREGDHGECAAVAGGIGEALITTAFGLVVAIPAVMVFNYFTNAIDSFVVDMNEVSSELISYMLREGRKAA